MSKLWVIERMVERLRLTSNNAPSKQKIPGTVLLSILAGHKRHAHITTVRSDKVLPELPGIEGLASEDSVRRAFTHASGEELTPWLKRCMNTVFEPLLNVGVQAGNQIASGYAHAGLLGWLDARPREEWPAMLRGDIPSSSEKTMCECEARGLPSLFKLRQTEGVVKHLVELSRRREWKFAGGGRPAVSSELPLQEWTKKRCVVVLRRPLPEQSAVCETETPSGQKVLTVMAVLPKTQRLFEYAVLVTSLPEGDVLTVAQQYRDRGDAENIFDELKNQWAWTVDGADRRAGVRLVEFVGAVGGAGRPHRGVTSRPALVYGVAKRTKHGKQSKVTITSCHGKADVIAKIVDNVNRFLLRFTAAAEQLDRKQRWARLVRIMLREFFPKRPQEPGPLLC